MSFPRYNEYHDSGLNWLGQVPTHWSLRRLGYYFGERREKVSDRDYQPLSVTKNGIVTQLETAAKTDDGDNRKRVCKGDFVINSRSDRKGSAGLSELDGSVSLISTVLKPKESVHGQFVHHLLRCIPFQEEFYRFGKGIVADLWSTNYASMSGITLAVPPLSEQEVIASFLDREAAKIDALITEQQQLIELLQEKRQAVISHAVTKGLTPNARMKDSGVEWLGEVPEHWSVVEARREIDFLTSGSRGWAEFYSDNGYLFLRIGNLTRDSIDLDLEDIQRVSPPEGAEGARTEVREGDVLFSITAYLGSVAVVPEALERAYVSQHVCLARLNGKNLLPKWLAYAVLSASGRAYLDAESYGGTKIQLSLDDIKSFPLAFPPLEEQNLIIERLEGSLAELKSLQSDCETNIALLQERRSALISAAVTGQIDVRGLVKAEAGEQ